jgi:hypothetical protein
MTDTRNETPTPPPPSLKARVLRTIHGIVEYDRRSWDRLLRQMQAQDRWVCRSIKALLRPAR